MRPTMCLGLMLPLFQQQFLQQKLRFLNVLFYLLFVDSV